MIHKFNISKMLHNSPEAKFPVKITYSDIMSNHHIGMALHTHLFHIHRAFHTAYTGESIAYGFTKSSYNSLDKHI